MSNSKNKLVANNKKTTKRGNNGNGWKKGQSGNPAGRPKDGESWSAIIKAVGDMYPEDILVFVGDNNDLANAIKQLPKNVQMKYLITTRVFAQLMFEPSSGLWRELMDRTEGKVKEQIDLTSNGQTIKPVDEQSINKSISELTKALGEIIPTKGTK